MTNEADAVEAAASVGVSLLEAVVMRTYYIAFEKHYTSHSHAKSWVIRNTRNDMDTVEGLKAEIDDIERESGCMVWIVNWRQLAA